MNGSETEYWEDGGDDADEEEQEEVQNDVASVVAESLDIQWIFGYFGGYLWIFMLLHQLARKKLHLRAHSTQFRSCRESLLNFEVCTR